MHNKVREPLFHIVKRDALPWYRAWGIRALAIVLALLLCALCAAGVCTFTEAEIATQLGEIFRGMIYVLQHADSAVTGVRPIERGSAESEKFEKEHPNLGEKR